MYLGLLPVGQQRSVKPKADLILLMMYFSALVEYGIDGAIWPETVTQFGTMRPVDWGCGNTVQGPSTNCYMRYHTTGSLELGMLVLDDYIMTGDSEVLTTYGIPFLDNVLRYYANRFPNIDNSTGYMDMFPTQALETYQCPDPTSRCAYEC